MFYDQKRNEMLLRLYAKSRAIGHVPSFLELDNMPDMPAANSFALHCGSYANAASTVEGFLSLKKPRSTMLSNVPEKVQEEMDVQDERIRKGWIPIRPYMPRKSLRELLDEVMKMANPEGVLPREFPVSFELKEKLKEVSGMEMAT